MKRYNLVNNITGWAVFIIAAFTYLLTIEPTASLWDCGEFIASAFKLEIGHPPGSQVFMILARVFTLFAGSDSSKAAAMVNSMSALLSAFTILFLFWTITHLARKIIAHSEEMLTEFKISAIMAAGVVGSLAFTFSDSFWFSAVEGEVYAMSSFFTAAVFWAILKWEDCADEPYANKWIILIAYLMGLSIGVHLLNLLTIPAIVLVYYFKKSEFTWKGFGVSLIVSVLMVALLMWGLIPGIVRVSSKVDLLFVNTFGLPANTGVIVHWIAVGALFVLAIRETLKNETGKKAGLFSVAAVVVAGLWFVSHSFLINLIFVIAISAGVWYLAQYSKTLLNLALTVVTVILIGYSSVAVILIRSSANTPLNENNPSNAFNLLYYLGREQYGSNPLFYGHYYNAPVLEYYDGRPAYALEDGKYIVTHKNMEREYDKRFMTIFPRMWSEQPEHAGVYQAWGGNKGIPIQVTDESGEKQIIKKPRFSENLKYAFSYQVGHMYLRYFMWNFSGRQNDTQGNGEAIYGNWITGFKFLDEPRTGTSDYPAEIERDPSRNKYYLLPFLLGLAGLFFQLNRDNRNWWIVLILFIMTGLAIVFYLNQYPNQPRERDYAYVGSFYFFSVWIGLGVLSVANALSKLTGEKIALPVAALVSLIAVPGLMASENWDDHDRSGRYLARDVAFNYLESCAPDAILFTNGDNDTFPLWYAQEVEGKRTDVRVANLMLLNTDWYIDQMKCKVYESDPLPVSLPVQKYYDGINNQVFIVEKTKNPVDITTVLDWVKSSNRETKVQVSANEWLDVLPTRTIRIPVDKDKVIASGAVKAEDSAMIVPYIDVRLKGSYILKSQLIVLDILANNNWERPIYFVTGYHDDALGMEEYMQLEGLAYRLVPVKSANRGMLDYGRIDTDILYSNLVNKFVWGGANDPAVNIDYNHRRTLLVIRARLTYAKLAKKLTEEGQNEKAQEVLDYVMEKLPLSNIQYDPYIPDIIEGYFASGNNEKGVEMSRDLTLHYVEVLDYFLKQKAFIVQSAEYEVGTSIQNMSKLAATLQKYGNTEMAKDLNAKVEEYYNRYVGGITTGNN